MIKVECGVESLGVAENLLNTLPCMFFVASEVGKPLDERKEK